MLFSSLRLIKKEAEFLPLPYYIIRCIFIQFFIPGFEKFPLSFMADIYCEKNGLFSLSSSVRLYDSLFSGTLSIRYV